ncbi:MAG: CHAT domain-containing protein, partial [Bacteroidota bacterium]
IKISNYHWNSGLLDHLFGQYLEAIHHYHKATDFHPLNREEMYLAIAKSYLEMDSLDQARRFIDLYDETVQVRDTAQLITRSELLAKINYIEKDVNEMNRQLKQSVEFASKYRLKYDRELGKTYARAGKLYYKTNQLSKALQYTNYALETFLSGFEFDTVYEIPEVYWLEKEVWVPDMIGLKGKVALKQFQNTGNSYYLETAVKSLQTSIDYFQRLNNNLEEESQQRLTGYMYPLFETLIECILLGNQSNGEDEKEAIFTLMQQSRNYSLKQEVREKAALSSSRIDPSILDVLDQILDQTRELQSQIVDIDNQDSVSFLKASFYDLIFKKNSILDSIATSNLKFNAYRRVEEPISLEECQSKLADSSMVIQIFQGEKALYILSISKDTSLFKSIELDSALQYSIQKVSSIIKDFDYIRDEPAKAEKAYLDNSHKVYSALLEPFLSHPSLQKVDRLMFSVSGALSDLSFESLINKRSDDWTEAENYLISRYSISYITDIRQAFVRSLQAKQANHSFLGIGIEYNNETLKKIDSIVNDSLISRPENINIRGISIGPLAFAVKEVKYLQEINGGKVLINEKARKDKVIDLLKQADLIHFSAHAFSDNSDPAKSSILLYSSKNDDDFILTAAEIGKMNLKAHQIVLSACQTASGRYVKGEGVLSLARYFIFSGAESVVASKWSIPDQISFYIMRSYYEHLNLGFSKDKALRRAKLNFLKNDRLSSPLTRLPSYWSSFCIYGSTQPL